MSVERLLGSIESDVKTVIKRIEVFEGHMVTLANIAQRNAASLETLKESSTDHNKRITGLEKKVWAFPLSAVAAFIAAKFGGFGH